MNIYDIAEKVKMDLRVIQKKMFRDLDDKSLTNKEQLEIVEYIKILQDARNSIDYYFKI